ncbi:MAG: extracellular solute-binding protein [Caldilineaceae bacterium]|nr:extracellular solute-binding protein [Caldilineaceae bacterium]
MQHRRFLALFSLLMVMALLLAACPAPAAPAPATSSEAAAPAAEATKAPESEAAAPVAPVAPAAVSDEVVTIEYWQYNFEARVTAMNQLIEMFEAENPNIKVVHNSDIPYAEFRDKIAASVPAGVGPDVASLFYGWQSAWIDAGYLVPLPEDAFPPAMVASDFSPMVQASFVDGTLYTLPTAVRTLALFYNKDLMTAAGLDPEKPPTTLDELAEQAVACTVRAANGDYEVEGFVTDLGAQDHHWFREVLVRQFGGVPYSDDGRTVMYNDDAGLQAWNYLLAFKTELETGDNTLFTDSTNAFVSGKVCFHVDGSFRLGTLASSAPDMNFGVAELPTHNGIQSTFGSYWTHGITKKAAADQARFDASVKFLQFITSAQAGSIWVDIVGELPAQLEAGSDPELAADPKLGAFARGLAYAHATFFADESAQRQAMIDAYDMVVLADEDPAVALEIAAETDQEILDGFFSK